jgi:hypothetical protein
MRKVHSFSIIIFFVLISILTNHVAFGLNAHVNDAGDKAQYNILVDLNECRLYLINKNTNEIIKTYPVAGGKRQTPSPIGTWKIISKAQWSKGFGTRWMQLSVPWGKYGIHGTNKPLTIGGAASLGCIRMFNENVEELYNIVGYGTVVVIYGGPYGMYTNEFRTLIPGDRGADVFEVQRRLKDRGYYNGTIDGIYDEGMKSGVIRFRREKKLRLTHNIDLELYNALEIKAFE